MNTKHTISGSLLSNVSLFMIYIAMYSIGTITGITVSRTIPVMLLVFSLVCLFFNHRSNWSVSVSDKVLVWMILSALCILGYLRGTATTDYVFYILGFLIFIFADGIGIGSLVKGLDWFKFFGLVFAAGCYWQLFFPQQYYAYLYPLFGDAAKQSIRRQWYFQHMYTGFTVQTAVTVQFVVLGLMAVLYTYSRRTRYSQKLVAILEIIVLAGGLILTGKRSPLINLGAAIITVDMLTHQRGKKAQRILYLILALIVAIIVVYIAAPLFSDSRNSFVRLFESFDSDDVNELSTGRFTLYSFALKEFFSHPLFGIGWGRYGRIYNTTGSHNIYLQLLCECGLVGCLLSVAGMLAVLIRTIRSLKSSIVKGDASLLTVSKCSVFIQMYILIYGFFGNPIYDQNYLLMYMIGILMSIAVDFRCRQLHSESIPAQNARVSAIIL